MIVLNGTSTFPNLIRETTYKFFLPHFSQEKYLLYREHLSQLHQALAYTEVAEWSEYIRNNNVFNPLSICISLWINLGQISSRLSLKQTELVA